jgi:hypothetical protein
MTYRRETSEALRLFAAFYKITNPDHRREIVELAEKYAPKSDISFR